VVLSGERHSGSAGAGASFSSVDEVLCIASGELPPRLGAIGLLDFGWLMPEVRAFRSKGLDIVGFFHTHPRGYRCDWVSTSRDEAGDR